MTAFESLTKSDTREHDTSHRPTADLLCQGLFELVDTTGSQERIITTDPDNLLLPSVPAEAPYTIAISDRQDSVHGL